MAHHLKHMEQIGWREASSNHNGVAEGGSVIVGSPHPDRNWDGGGDFAAPIVDSHFMTYSDKPLHPMSNSQDTMGFTSGRAGVFRSSKDFQLQKTTEMEEDKDVQKLLTKESQKPAGFSAIGVALLSLAAIVGVRMRRGMQQAIAVASSGVHGIDMSLPMEPVPVDDTLESLCSQERTSEQVLQGSERALANDMHADMDSPVAFWDPLDLSGAAHEAHVEDFRESELQHRRVAMATAFFIYTQKPSPGPITVPAHPPPRTQRYSLNDHIDFLHGNFEATSVDGFPSWVQDTLETQGLNVLTFDEANSSLFYNILLVLGLASYVGKQTGYGKTQELSDAMKAERRRRSGMDNDEELPGEEEIRTWFEDE
jgi:hypothetical protein